MIQKIIAFSLFAAVCAVGAPALTYAQTASTTAERTAISCVGAAVATREAALQNIWSTRSSAVSAAYSARATALAAAYSKTTKAEVRAGVEAAWKAFRSSVTEARQTWKKARLAAWQTSHGARKSCRASTDISDTSKQGTEGSI